MLFSEDEEVVIKIDEKMTCSKKQKQQRCKQTSRQTQPRAEI